MKMKRIALITTGGTIGSLSSGGKVAGEELVSAVDTSSGRRHNILLEDLCRIPSHDMSPLIWIELARRVQFYLDDECVDGVVVTHGTDTIEETAYFLSLVITSQKPIVLTGSMRKFDEVGFDGVANLIDAITIAQSDKVTGIGVVVCFNGEIHSAKFVTKVHATALSTFKSEPGGPIGHVLREAVMIVRPERTDAAFPDGLELPLSKQMPSVAIVHGFAGIGPEIVEAVASSGVKGIVVVGSGNGNIPAILEPALLKCYAQGIHLVRASRCIGDLSRSSARDFDGGRMISSRGLSALKSRILLMTSLATRDDAEFVRRAFDYVGGHAS